MTHADIRTLAQLATEAAAALIPLSADPAGRDSHGGNLLHTRPQIVARALTALEHAGRLAARLRLSTGHPGKGSNL